MKTKDNVEIVNGMTVWFIGAQDKVYKATVSHGQLINIEGSGPKYLANLKISESPDCTLYSTEAVALIAHATRLREAAKRCLERAAAIDELVLGK